MVKAFYDAAMTDMLGEYDRNAVVNLVGSTVDSEAATTVIYEQDDRIVGVIAMLAFPHPFKPSKVVAQELFWWVLPEYRQSGAGNAMLDEAERWSESVGAEAMIMVTMHGIGHEFVGQFYQKKGYTPLEYSFVKRL